MRVHAIHTRSADELARLAVEGALRRTVVVACGGDGTVSAVASALAGTDAILGVVPGGRGNDFARALRIPMAAEAAAEVLLRGAVVPTDLGRAGERWFCTVAMAGLDAEVARASRVSRLPGTVGYLAAMLRRLPGWKGVPLRLTGDFGLIEERLTLVAVGNTAAYGAGMHVVPPASPSDGMLHLCVVVHASRRRLLRILPGVYRGTHVRHPEVRILASRDVLIESAEPVEVWGDGEPLGATPMRLEAVPAAVRVLVPPPAQRPP